MENEKTVCQKFYLSQTDWFTLKSIGLEQRGELLLPRSPFFSITLPFPHHRLLPCLPPSLFPSRFFLGINNFYRPSGRWNGKRRRPFNFSRVWRVSRGGFPLRKCKGRNTPCRDIVVTSTSRRRKQELTGAGNLVADVTTVPHNGTVLISQKKNIALFEANENYFIITDKIGRWKTFLFIFHSL